MSSIDIATLFASPAEGGSALIDDKIMSPARVAEQVATRQPLAALLTALAGLTVAADELVYANGASSLAVAALSPYARQILAATNAAAVKALLAVASTDVTDATTVGRQILTAANAAAVKALLAVASADVTDASAVGRQILTAANVAAVKALLAVASADVTDASAVGRQILTAANAAAVKALLAVASADVTDASAIGRQILTAANAAAVKVLLGIAVGDVAGLTQALAGKVSGNATWTQVSVTFDANGLSGNIAHGLGTAPSVVFAKIYGDVLQNVITYFKDQNNFILKMYNSAGVATSGTFAIMYLAMV